MGSGMAKEPRPLTAGTVINGYRVERELGRGAMAVVYLATQLDLERPVALKVLSAELAADAEFVARFFNEARAAASMSHPHIVQAYDAGVAEGGIYYFCMEYVDGETLLQRLNRQTRLDAQTCVAMALDIADALNFGWQRQKFTHGDIKPENIMINTHEQAKLADFGLAKVEGHDYDGTDIMLTPLYAPPELIRGERGHKDCRSDIYAFGATLYHALAGSPPFPGDNAQVVLQRHLKEPLEPLRQRYAKAPQWFSDVVGRMLEKDLGQRPQSWEEVIEGLKKVQSGLLLMKPSESPGDGAALKRAKVVYASEGKGLGGGKRVITPQERKAVRRTSQGVLMMFALAIALSVGAVFLKQHVDERNQAGQPEPALVAPAVVPAGAGGNQAAAPSVKPLVSSETPAVATVTGAPAGAVPAVAVEPAEAAVSVAPVPDEPVVVPAAFALRMPDVTLPIVLDDKQQVTAAWLEAAWCLSGLRYDFNLAMPVEPMSRVVTGWLETNAHDTAAGALMLFLRDTALPALADGKALLVSNKGKVLGRTLVGKRDKQYMIQDVTFERLEVQELLPNGHVVRALSWQELTTEGLVDELFREAFYNREKEVAQCRSYLAYLAFTNQPKALAAALKPYPESDERRSWEMLLALNETISGKNLEVVRGWQELRLACSQGLSIRAYFLAAELRKTRNSVSLVFADVLDGVLQRCAGSVPEVQGALLLRGAPALLRQEPLRALNQLLLAKARYGAANFPEKSKLEDLQNEALSGLSAGVNNTEPNVWDAVPFVVFGRPEQSPHRSYIANVFVSHKEDLATTVRGALPGLRTLSLLEMGDWLQASKLAEDKPVTALLEGQALFRYPAFFGRALLAMRYGLDPAIADNGAVALTQIPLGLEKNPAMYIYAPEYALLSRRADREFLYRFRTFRPGLDLRGAPAVLRRLQYFDLCLCLEGAGRKDAMNSLYAIAEGDAGAATGFNSEILRADAHRMHEMIRLGAGDFYPPIIDTALPDMQLRLALACMDEGALAGDADETFMQLVESDGMRWSLIGGDAIYDWVLRRCATDLAFGDVAAAVTRVRWALALPYSCLYPYYGRLMLLQAGLHSLAGQSCGLINANSQLQAATVCSEVEKRLARAVFERDSGRAQLSQLGYGHAGHYLYQWLYVTYRIGCGETIDDIEQRFSKLPLPTAERCLVAGLRAYQQEIQALAAASGSKP